MPPLIESEKGMVWLFSCGAVGPVAAAYANEPHSTARMPKHEATT